MASPHCWSAKHSADHLDDDSTADYDHRPCDDGPCDDGPCDDSSRDDSSRDDSSRDDRPCDDAAGHDTAADNAGHDNFTEHDATPVQLVVVLLDEHDDNIDDHNHPCAVDSAHDPPNVLYTDVSRDDVGAEDNSNNGPAFSYLVVFLRIAAANCCNSGRD